MAMMNNTSKKPFNLPPGTTITGKWHGASYTIMRELGYGANGIVYLVRDGHGYQALKMSDNNVTITSEVNVLKAFSKLQGTPLGPGLMDVDDWEYRGEKIPFYTMEYIQGPTLLSFVQGKGFSWTGVLVAQLLADLERIHQAGWVFGDLKPENLIVTGAPHRIRCIDVGGTTIQGRAIKEFTEFFDRGYWIGGSRRAEPSYDLFAVGMILINLAYPNRFPKRENGQLQQLKLAVEGKDSLRKYRGTIFGALEGTFSSAQEMREDLLRGISRSANHGPAKKQAHKPASARKTPQVSQKKPAKQSRASRSLETVLIILIVGLIYFLYIYDELL